MSFIYSLKIVPIRYMPSQNQKKKNSLVPMNSAETRLSFVYQSTFLLNFKILIYSH